MNKESRNYQEDQEIFDALQRYEQMLKKGSYIYFDVFQLEYIIDSFLDEGKIFQAMQAVEMGMNLHPTSLALKIKKANILLNLGEVTNSLELTNQLVQIEDTNYELHLLKGSSLLLLGQTEEALHSFNLSLQYSSEDRDETLFNIGYAYEQIGDYKKAVGYLEEALKIDEENEEALYELAFCYEKTGENEKSIEYYDKYLDIETFSDSAWFNLGILYTKTDQYEKSIWAYEMALALNEDFPNAWFNLGHSYILMENYIAAIESFKHFIEFENDNDDVYCYIADCFLSIDDEDNALIYYQKAKKINALNAKACYGCGLIEKNNGNLKASLSQLKKAVKVDEENSAYHYSYAVVAAELNKYKEATDSFNIAIELNPFELDYWLSFAEMMFIRGMVVSAIETLQSANEFHPNNALIQYKLAAYHFDSMKDKDGLKYLEKALKEDYSSHLVFITDYPEALYNSKVVKLINKYKTTDSSI